MCSSDHTLLEHTLLLGKPLEDEYRYGYKRASEKDWFDFSNKVEENLNFDLPDKGSYAEFDEGVEKFYKVIYDARETTIPKSKIDPLALNKHIRGGNWYTSTCKQLQNQN